MAFFFFLRSVLVGQQNKTCTFQNRFRVRAPMNTSGTCPSSLLASASPSLPPPPDALLEYPVFFTQQKEEAGKDDEIEQCGIMEEENDSRIERGTPRFPAASTSFGVDVGAVRAAAAAAASSTSCDGSTSEIRVHSTGSPVAQNIKNPLPPAPRSSPLPFRHITLFTSLYWLFPLYILAGWVDRNNPAVVQALSNMRSERNERKKSSGDEGGDTEGKEIEDEEEEDVRLTRCLLPLLERFFEEKQRLIPPHAMVYRQVQLFHFPTPKGARSVSRAKVEGEEEPPRPSFLHAKMAPSASAAAVVNPPGVFCLWPGHNQFLLHYESASKLRRFSYIELDQLRFAFVALKEYLLEEYRIFNLHDGTLTGLAKRDIKKNCRVDARWSFATPSLPSSFSHSNGGGGGSTTASHGDKNSTATRAGVKPSSSAAAAGGGAPLVPSRVGQGGGNARLHQGTSGNVVTAPSAAEVQQRKDALQKRFLKEELQHMCLARWPHAPLHKSCIYMTVDEKRQCDMLGAEKIGVTGGGGSHRKGQPRKGPMYYLSAVELPLFNKKGGSAKFVAEAWWPTKVDADADAAQVAIRALQNLK